MGDLLRAELLGPDTAGERTVEDFFASTLLDSPWADPDLPSWVAEDEEGRVIGFLAVHARRMRLGDRPVRMACCSHLTVDGRRRGGAAGPMLLRRCLQGPQDLTISDTAIDVVARVWRVLGGHVDAGRSCEWMHVLRPGALGLGVARRRIAARRTGGAGAPSPLALSEVRFPGLPLHVAGRLLPQLRRLEVPETTSTVLDPAEAVELLPALARAFRLRPAYDERYLAWLLAQFRPAEGELVCRLVRHAGRAVGWYVYELRPTGRGRVLQVVADHRGAEAVVADLFADAGRRGCTVLSGRLEPHLREALHRRLTALVFGARHVAHSRHADVLAALQGDAALLTLLDGEWW